MIARGTPEWATPVATSPTVPSPPMATTRSKRPGEVAAPRASSVAWPAWVVVTYSHVRNAGSSSRKRRQVRSAARLPASGFRIASVATWAQIGSR